ncbi:hypothetical protein WJX79_010194 [Trebouxia sp. C0005]
MAALAGHASRNAVTNEAPTDRIFARYLEWIQECKEAIHTLRMCIKQARAHREKCCSVLGAALGAALALEQAVYSGTLHTGKAQELQRLCAAVTAAIELSQQRVQVYGGQSGVWKYASLARRSAIEAKFSHLVERLEQLTKQAWTLQNSSKPVGIQQDMRIHANSRLETASSLQGANAGLVTRSRLRRGCQCHTVQSVLYVGHTQGKTDSANTSGQIWWCLTSSTGSKLFAHDLATTTTSELQSFQSGLVPAVTCMQLDSQGYVWMGFKGGMLQVWDADRRACLCQSLHMAPADVRVITVDSERSNRAAGSPLFTPFSRQPSRQPSGHFSGQPLSSLPLLGPGSNPLGRPPSHPPCRTMSAELMHASTLLTHKATPGNQEWSFNGDLLMSHACNDLGSVTCISPVPDLKRAADVCGGGLRAGLRLVGRCDGTVASAGVTDTRQHVLQLLERHFTPRSAKAVEKALGTMGQQLAQEEEAQGHRLSPGLAALQRGDLISSHDAPGVLKEVVHLLNLSHADSNDLPLAAHQPGAPARSPLGYQEGTENLPVGYHGIAEASPAGLPNPQQGGLNGPRLVEHTALSPMEQALYQRQHSRSELPDLLRGPSTEPQYSQRESYEYSQSHRAGSVYSMGTAHDFASAQSHDLQSPLIRYSGESVYRSFMDPESISQQTGEAAQGSFADAQRRSGEFVHRSSADSQQAQRQSREMVRCMSKEQLARQQAMYWSTWHPQTEDDKRLQRRVSFTGDVDHNAAATAAAHNEPSQPEASHLEPARAGPPPPTAEYSSVAQGQQDEALPSAAQLSAFYHSVNALLPRRGSTTSELSIAHSSPGGSTHRGASQLLRLESRASDPFSNAASSRQDSLTMPESTSGRALTHSHSQSRGSSGVSGGSGPHSVKRSGGPPNLHQSSLSMLQGIEQVTVAPHGMPRSRSHKNLRQGLERISADLQPEPDCSAPAVAAAGQPMRRTKSQLGLDTLASVESMNCPIIDYSQLEIKRKIGDGSIGQVYLGKWQETDVAVKVLTEMQNLSSHEGVHPQDPSNMDTWEGDGPPPRQGGEKATKAGGLKLIDSDSHGWGSDDDDVSSIGVDSEVVPSEERQEALRTLEREVSIMAALRHPNVVMFMGLCLEPPCIVTEFCARGSLYDVLKKARGTPAFAQQLDWSRRISMALDAAKGVLQLHSHKPPILHRDLKSPNMLVDRHWRVKVTDFNLSRMVKSGSSNASVTSMLANNPRWLAPEVVSKHDYSKAADVYSFGIILWEMMTWRLPWDELNPFQIMLVLTQQLDRPEIPPLDTLPGQPLPGIEDYIGLMQDCWSEDVSKRPRFEDIIISLRGLLESANNRHKLQKTLTAVPRLSTSCAVPPNMNKLAVVGQTPFGAPGTDPQQTPTPLEGQAKPGPLQVYETDRPFFGSTPVGGLDIMTSSRHGTDKGVGGSDHQKHPISGGQAQQQIWQSALRSKGRSPTRRHTFGGTATNFGDQFDTAPSIFNSKGSIEGATLESSRRKSLSAAPRFGQSAVPAWLREQGSPVRSSISQVLGSLTQAKGSITQAIGSIGQVIGGTPFSAFAQESLKAQSHHSSDDSESDQLPFKHLSAEPSTPEESRGGGSLAKRKSGPFGGRGVALGHMMAAQQQWRQDSFSRAQQERRKSDESTRNGGENETTRLASRDEGHHKHQGRAESGNNAEGGRPVGGSTGDALGDEHFMGWSSRQAQRCGLLGKAGSVWGESLDSTGWKGDANLGQEKPPASQTAVATAARHSSRNVSDHSSHGRQNLVGSPRAQHKRERSGGKHMAVSQADQEMRSPFEALQFQHRSSDARAGPPPAKIVFRNSLAESSSSGASTTSPDISSGGSDTSYGSFDGDKPSARSSHRPPPTRRLRGDVTKCQRVLRIENLFWGC